MEPMTCQTKSHKIANCSTQMSLHSSWIFLTMVGILKPNLQIKLNFLPCCIWSFKYFTVIHHLIAWFVFINIFETKQTNLFNVTKNNLFRELLLQKWESWSWFYNSVWTCFISWSLRQLKKLEAIGLVVEDNTVIPP